MHDTSALRVTDQGERLIGTGSGSRSEALHDVIDALQPTGYDGRAGWILKKSAHFLTARMRLDAELPTCTG